MSLNVTFNGLVYIIPETGEVGWGGNTTSYLIAIAAGALQKTGGSFTLSAETDFGASFGLKSLYYKSRSTNIATTGILRLNNNSDAINWRNSANNANIALYVDSSDNLSYNGTFVLTGSSPTSYVSSILGTANQVIASSPTGTVTLSLPQSINSTANVQFSTLGLGSSIVASSILSLTSTALGFLPPRMTTTQRDAIATPATGLFIYNTTTGVYNFYNGVSWSPIAAGGSINPGVAGFFAYYPTSGTTIDDQALLSTDGINITLTSGQYLSPNGTAALPTYSFSSDPDTGIYRVASNGLGFSLGGVLQWSMDAGGNLSNNSAIGQLTIANGTAAIPSLSFVNDSDTGLFSVSNNIVGISVGGTERLQLSATALIPSVNDVFSLGSSSFGYSNVFLGNGTGNNPSYTFKASTGTGMYLFSPNVLGFSAGGFAGAIANSSGQVQFLGKDGTAAAPYWSFANQGDIGMYLESSNQLSFSVAGGIKLRLETTLTTNFTSFAIPSTSKLYFDGGSDTFLDEVSGNVLRCRAGNLDVWEGDDNSTADETRFLLYDITAGTYKRVSRGAADSGGLGFRQLVIPN